MSGDEKVGAISIRYSSKIGTGRRIHVRREGNWARFKAGGEEPGRQEVGKVSEWGLLAREGRREHYS